MNHRFDDVNNYFVFKCNKDMQFECKSINLLFKIVEIYFLCLYEVIHEKLNWIRLVVEQ